MTNAERLAEIRAYPSPTSFAWSEVQWLLAQLDAAQKRVEQLVEAASNALPRLIELSRYREEREGTAFAQDFSDAILCLRAVLASCPATTPTTSPLGTVQCSREAGHDGLHRHGTEALPRVTWK